MKKLRISAAHFSSTQLKLNNMNGAEFNRIANRQTARRDCKMTENKTMNE